MSAESNDTRDAMPDRKTIQLFAAAVSGTISEDELAELDALLRSDETTRRAYLRFSQMHMLLEKFPPGASDAAVEESLSPRRLTKFPARVTAGWIAAAAAVAIAAIVAVKPSGETPVTHDPHIATLVFAERCEWGADGAGLTRPPLEGGRLKDGNYHLKKGTAVIRFDGGAEMIVTRRSQFSLLSPERVALEKGNVVVRADDGAEGFAVDTPAQEIVDLGTEFAVRVRNGITDLHVHEGTVAADERIFSAGQGGSFAPEGEFFPGPTDFRGRKFAELLRRANPKERRDLMTAYEGFFVDEGTYADGDLGTGWGWAGPWRMRAGTEILRGDQDTSDTMRIVSEKMSMAWPVHGGREAILEMPPGRNVRIRPLKKPVDMRADKITYFSFLVAEPTDPLPVEEKTEANSAKGERWKRRHDFRVTLRSSEGYFDESLSFGWTKTRRPHIGAGNSGVFRSLREIPAGQTVFCVGKIESSLSGEDRVSFRFYTESDPLDLFEPADWDAESRGLDLQSKLDLVLISTWGRSPWFVDELRIGTTWRSVTPIDGPRDSL